MGSGQPSLRVPGSSLHSEEHAAGDFDALGDCAALAAPATNSTWRPPLRTSGNSGNSPNSSPARTQSPHLSGEPITRAALGFTALILATFAAGLFNTIGRK